MSISVVVGLSGVSTSMAESTETETEGIVLSEEDTNTEQINEDDIGDTNEGVEEDIEKDQESKINEEQEVGTEETINDCIETEVEVTVTPTPEPTETPVTEEQRETFDYDSVYQSLATTWKEGTDNRRDQVVLSALKKVDQVKYLKGAGHTEDYIGLYGLTGVESSLYLVDNSEFLDDTGLVAATEAEGTVFSPKADGSLVINGLEADTYVLTEIHTSDGYSLLKDPITIEFKQTVDTITPSVATVTGNPNPNVEVIYTTGDRAYAKVDGKAVQMSADNQSANARANMEVINTNSFLLPQTGGLGTLLFTILGACAVIVGIMVVTKKSKKEAK